MDSTINFNTYAPSENCASYFFWYLCQFCPRAFCKLDDCLSHTVSLHRDDFLEAALDDDKQQLKLWTESEIDGEAETELETDAEGETETDVTSNECDDIADLKKTGTNVKSASSPASGHFRSRLKRNATRHKDIELQDNNENDGTKTTTTTGKRKFSHVNKKRTTKIVTTILKSGRKASQCRYCYKFIVSNFDDHEQMHVGGRAYTCRYCKKKFCWKNYLKYHEDRCNSRENPPKSFKRSKSSSRKSTLSAKSNENLSKSNQIIPFTNARTTRLRPCPQQKHPPSPGTRTKSLTQGTGTGTVRKNKTPRIKLKSTKRTAQLKLISNNEVHSTKNISVRTSSKMLTKNNNKQLKTRAGVKLASKLKSKSSKLLMLKEQQENVAKAEESPCWVLRQRGGIPIYVCKLCGKGYGQKQNVKRHYQTHSGFKAHRCSTCPRAFSTKSVLIDHENQHLNIQAHSCQYCHKLFTWKSSKYLHERQRMCQT